MRRYVLAVALCAAFASMVPLKALADKTVTFLKTGSAVTSINFDFLSQPGTVLASVCGRSPLSGGGFSQVTCYPVSLTSGAIFTAAVGLATGQGLVFWQTQEAL